MSSTRERSGKSRWRRIKFALLRRVVFPVVAPLFLLWCRSWRLKLVAERPAAELLAEPRIIMATFHGMLLPLLSASRIAREHRRELVVLVSPSRDGDLFADLLDRIGVRWVRGSTKSRAIPAVREFLRFYEDGLIGLIAVDGPRGPCCEERSGILRMAQITGARILMVVGGARRGVSLKSWDRALVPLPFTEVQVGAAYFEPPDSDEEEVQRAALRAQLLAVANDIGSAVIPPALRKADAS